MDKDNQNRAKLALKIQSQYKMAFSTEEGKEVLKDLILSCGAMTTSFVPGDSHQTAYNEGRREIVNRILSMIEADPERYQKLFSEVEEEMEVLE